MKRNSEAKAGEIERVSFIDGIKKRFIGINKTALNKGDSGHLSDLRRGQTGRVTALHNDNAALRRRLLDMGITKGVEITVKKIAPMGDPVDVELRGYELCIRMSDMRNIDIEVVR